MASRFYFSSTKTTALTPAYAAWDRTSEADRRMMETTKDGSAMTSKTMWAGAAAAMDTDCLNRQYISHPMASGIAFSTSDTIKGVVRCMESATNDNIDRAPICLKVVSSDGNTIRATLKALAHYGYSTIEWARTTPASKRYLDGDTLDASYTTVDGDRLVLEIGGQIIVDVAGVSVTGTQSFGSDSGTDLAETEDVTTAYNPWFEISRDITFLKTYKDTATRFKVVVATTAYKDTATRFKLGVTSYKDTATRFRASGQAYKDTKSRFRSRGLLWKDVDQPQCSYDDWEPVSSGASSRSGLRWNSFPAGIIYAISLNVWKGGIQGQPTGTGYVRVRKVSDDSIIGTLGQVDVSTLIGTYTVFDTTPVTISTTQDIRILFEYDGGGYPNNFVGMFWETEKYGGTGVIRTRNFGGYTDFSSEDIVWIDLFYDPYSTHADTATRFKLAGTAYKDTATRFIVAMGGISPVTRVEITPATASSWQTVDISSYIPAGATGALLHVVSNTAVTEYDFGARKYGSSDDRHGSWRAQAQGYVLIGVSSDRKVDIYVGSTTVLDVYLVGFTIGGIDFLTTGVDVTPSSLSTWEDKDVSANIPANAYGVIVERYNSGGSTYYCGIRDKGCPDDMSNRILGHDVFLGITGCTNRVFQTYKSSTYVTIHLVGYITDYFTLMRTDINSFTPSQVGVYEDAPAVPSQAYKKYGIFHLWTGGASYQVSLRTDGSSDDYYWWEGRINYNPVMTSSAGIIELKTNNLQTSITLGGYQTDTPTSWKDASTRFKVYQGGYKDTATRFKLWATSYKDVAVRFKESARAYKDIATRFKTTIQAYKDTAVRFKLIAGTTAYIDTLTRFKVGILAYKDAAVRFKETVRAYKDAGVRFKLNARSFIDVQTRFKPTVQAYKDTSTRFKAIAQAYRDTSTRFKVAVAALAYKDTSTRYESVIGTWGNEVFFTTTAAVYIDIGTRFKVYAQNYRDVATRTKVQVQGYGDASTRFRLWVSSYKDVSVRFRTYVLTYRDTSTRFKLNLLAYKDVATRVKLWSTKDVATRFKLNIRNYVDTAVRFKVLAGGYVDTKTRFKLQSAHSYADAPVRFKVQIQAYKDVGTRAKFWVQGFKDTSTRFKIKVLAYKDTQTRFKLIGALTYVDTKVRFKVWVSSWKDISTRFRVWGRTFGDTATRFSVATATYRDVATRFKVTPAIHVKTRFVLGQRPAKFQIDLLSLSQSVITLGSKAKVDLTLASPSQMVLTLENKGKIDLTLDRKAKIEIELSGGGT